MNKINNLIDAINQIQQKLCEENDHSDEILAQIIKKLFNQDVQNENDLKNILITQFQQSGLNSIDEYIDYLLYKLDSTFDLDLELNYKLNDLILSEMSNPIFLYQQQVDTTDSEELGKQCRKRQ